jgi:hypothetical protein
MSDSATALLCQCSTVRTPSANCATYSLNVNPELRSQTKFRFPGLAQRPGGRRFAAAASSVDGGAGLELLIPFRATALDSADPAAVHRLVEPAPIPAQETCSASPGKSGREASGS